MVQRRGPDHYEALGVAVDATSDQIRAAYIRLARLHHPDCHVDAPVTVKARHEQSMRDANAAWAVLGNATSRARYDHGLFEDDELVGNAHASDARARRWAEDERAKAAWRPYDERPVDPDPRLADDDVASPAPRSFFSMAWRLTLLLAAMFLVGGALTGIATLAGAGIVLGVAGVALFCALPLRALNESVRNDRR